jgi:UDP-N-acetylglucosamine 2-epimerase (non-hydrolysing)
VQEKAYRSLSLSLAEVVGTDRTQIVAETRRLLLDADHYGRIARGGSPYGDGHAADTIRDIICRYLRDVTTLKS